MSVVIACPSCGVQLEVGEDLLGRTIRCASCGHVFQATAPPPASRSEVTSAPAEPSPSRPSAPSPLSESSQQPAPPRREVCPRCGANVERDDVRCRRCGEHLEEDDRPRRRSGRWGDEYEDEEDEPWRLRRRDAEPHRGTLILTFGIISLVCGPAALVCCQIFSLPGLILGILALVWGNRDLKEMAAGRMDPEGKGSTNAGWICGLVGIILNILAFLVLIALLAFYGFALFTMQPPPPPAPPPPPPPVPPPQGF